MNIIAIDPGENGAIVIMRANGAVEACKMPDTPKEIFELLVKSSISGAKCYIEKVGGYVPGNSSTAAVKFARHMGHLDMALIAACIPTEQVAPIVWQKKLGALSKEKPERKRQIKDMMQRRYPGLKVTLWNADALGIMAYWEIRNGR